MGTFRDETEKENQEVEDTTSIVSDATTTNEPTTDTETVEEVAPQKQPFDEWLAGIDEDYKTELNNRVGAGVNKYVEDTYGDLLPLLPELASDRELQKQFAKLSNKELRKFVFENAYEIFDGTPAEVKAQAEAAVSQIPKEYEERLAATEAELSRTKQAEVDRIYQDERRNEVAALMNEHPELRFAKQDSSDPGYKLTSYLVDLAEERTQRNFNKGINKIVTYKEVYEQHLDVSGKQPLGKKIPNTSEAGPPKLQAPKNATEGKKQFLAAVKKAGGFKEYARIIDGQK